MAGDMMLVMRGLTKLSQAIMETQANTLRNGGAQAMAQSMGVAMQKMQVGTAGVVDNRDCYKDSVFFIVRQYLQ